MSFFEPATVRHPTQKHNDKQILQTFMRDSNKPLDP